jgi:hypothetical protein
MYIFNITPPAGLEPATFGLEVQHAIHCAKGDDPCLPDIICMLIINLIIISVLVTTSMGLHAIAKMHFLHARVYVYIWLV